MTGTTKRLQHDTKKWVVVKIGNERVAWFPLKMASLVYMGKRNEIFNKRISIKVMNKGEVFRKKSTKGDKR